MVGNLWIKRVTAGEIKYTMCSYTVFNIPTPLMMGVNFLFKIIKII